MSSAAESCEVAGRQLVDGERSHSSPPTSQTPPATNPTTVDTAVNSSNLTAPFKETVPKQVAWQPQGDERPHTSLPTSQTSTVVDGPRILTGKQNESRGTVVTAHASISNPQQERRICNYYRRGKCRHGGGGKVSVYGEICKFFHPKKCSRFCKFGFDRVKGCNRSCGLFHPIICQSSIDLGACYNPKCSLQHLHGTFRGSYDNSTNPQAFESEGFPHYRQSLESYRGKRGRDAA